MLSLLTQSISTEGEDMQIEHLTYKRCFDAIYATTSFDK